MWGEGSGRGIWWRQIHVFSTVMDKHGSLTLHFPVQCSRKSASRVCAGLVCKGLGFPTLTLSARSPVLFGMALLQFLCLHQFCPQSNKANYRRGVPPHPFSFLCLWLEWSGKGCGAASCRSAMSHCRTEMWVTAVSYPL